MRDISYKYCFVCDEVVVLEAKVNGLPDGTPIGEVFHWLMYDQTSRKIERLTFKGMRTEDGHERRFFEQGELTFDDARAELVLNDVVFVLTTQGPGGVPKDIARSVEDFLDR